ncbi:hypothetical protein LZ30DRAFT_705955 [Colletotrichum cereale]|nr:hypothetical protein LZ30DRAFT_705955 [Colletotrichum cereale]
MHLGWFDAKQEALRWEDDEERGLRSAGRQTRRVECGTTGRVCSPPTLIPSGGWGAGAKCAAAATEKSSVTLTEQAAGTGRGGVEEVLLPPASRFQQQVNDATTTRVPRTLHTVHEGVAATLRVYTARPILAYLQLQSWSLRLGRLRPRNRWPGCRCGWWCRAHAAASCGGWVAVKAVDAAVAAPDGLG